MVTHRTAGCFVQMVADGSPPFHAAAAARDIAAGALDRAGGGDRVGLAVLLGALVLWFHYGTAVFFEMIASGISACF